MSEFRVGQRVRITQEGVVTVLPAFASGGMLTIRVDDSSIRYAHTSEVEVLAEPRPDEPTGLGAVVEAHASTGGERRVWVSHPDPDSMHGAHVWTAQGMEPRLWHALLDPVIRHDGYRAT